ncbi:MAG: Unknown protein [uncultured Thiotrichaceae bacterium]|uniref:Copper metallochaperone, bacterial analog of Cox17 protein n=1 Tax=uncultured Thiotrichaceae bacterium TaxID=298394 RepID=A0A6S6SPV7_9GAMM|nr:MAG: Unknown protein [uncultured Thiotrichaceae bacterium]
MFIDNNYFRNTFALLLIFLLPACNSGSSTLDIHEPWIRTPAPNAQALAGYMLIENNTDAPVTLLQAKAEGFNHVMIHQSINENGTHKMEHAGNLVIPANSAVRFQHGSYHIMFMGINRDIKPGDQIPVTLIFDNTREKDVSFLVKD